MLTATEQLAELHPIDYRSLVADFRAAAWCAAHASERDDVTLLRNFHRIHDYFLRAIDRHRPGLFAGVDRAFLIEIVRKWVDLYLRGVAELRGRFPRTKDSADLVTGSRNWSERLEISYQGLDRLDLVSRYAEFWAERSITWATTGDRGRGVYETYAERVDFVGSPYYVTHDRLKRARQLMIRDRALNGIPAFDIRAAFAECGHAREFEGVCERRDWIVEHVHPAARLALWRSAREA